MAGPFTFDNRTGRPTGVFTRTLGMILPGVAAVQRQVPPYAQAWREHNLAVLAAASRKPRWVAFGDSMTQSIGASDPMRGWVPQLAERLTVEVDVINLGQSGGRVSDVLDQQLPAWRSLPEVEAEIVTVLIGSNDVMSPRYRGALPDAFAELLAALPEGAVISTLPSPHRVATEVNRLIAEADRGRRVRAVPTHTMGASAWRGRLAADRFHPNDDGYTMIADLFEPYVAGALSRALGSRTSAA